MRSYHVSRSRNPPAKTSRFVWPLLVCILLLVNIYLFGIRGFPGNKTEAPSSGDRPVTAALPKLAGVNFTSPFGEMAGVGGIREPGTDKASIQALRRNSRSVGSRARFDLESAASIAGQRSMENWCRLESGTIGRGQTFSTSLNEHDLAMGQVNELVAALQGVMDFRHCRVGEKYELLISPKGQTQRFVYHKTTLVTYQADRHEEKMKGRRVELDAEVQVVDIGVRIDGSLYLSLDRAGEHAALVMMIVDIFAWDIDFYVDTHPGDTIKLVVEKLTLDGQFVRYGEILAAEYAGTVGTHQAYRYTPENSDKVGYFDEKGGSLRKAFLKTPLKFARISSGFGRRVHPVLGFNKMHNGTDFAAPIGTPIWAPADGTVRFAGRKGANGNLIVLRHANGYETIYAHLHRIGKGVRRGGRVRQKQVIGTVGNTGRSTGPHLHYGMRLRGRYVNPLRQKFPPAKPIPKAELDNYHQSIATWVKRLTAIQPPGGTRTASIQTESKDAG
ncbi:MAG: M23 family metallopeptidase [Deltaproteobacteria bacterium]|nr:M23 family metallopeptidase [Deltaproteobacteria bacterium]